jgi:hypothetical protein
VQALAPTITALSNLRQRDPKGRSFTRGAVKADLAALQLREFARDIQTKSCATPGFISFEYERLQFLSDALPHPAS